MSEDTSHRSCAPPVEHPSRPKLQLPPLSCDAHFHVFGPHSVFPFAAKRPFTPPDAPKEKLFALHRHLGFQRGVIVQSSCHGSDHAAVLDALAAGKGHYCGVALLAPATTAAEVARLDAAGFCGVRFHFAPHLGPSAKFDDLWKIVHLVAPHNWHIAVHGTDHALLGIVDFIKAIKAPVVIDHIGRTPIAEGINGAAFTALRRLVDTGRVWVKLSGIDRISVEDPPFRDAIVLARTIAQQAPERILWGTDWPHPNVRLMPDDGQLVDAIAEIAPDAATRQRMLVDNPAAFFRFSDKQH